VKRALGYLLFACLLALVLDASAAEYRCPGNVYTTEPGPRCVRIEDRVSTVPAPRAWREKPAPKPAPKPVPACPEADLIDLEEQE